MNKDEILTIIRNKPLPNHIAIILDGNGRWAQKRGLPRIMGHEKGAKTLKEITVASKNLGIKYLSAFVFSTENWKRPKTEVDYIMNQIIKICNDYQFLVKNNIKLMITGTKNKLSEEVINAINLAITKTSNCNKMTLNLVFNYGAKQEIVDCVKKITTLYEKQQIKISDIDEKMIEKNLYHNELPDVDLMIRTSGEIRISNFLLWQIAYAELYFTKTYWPDFHPKELYLAILEYQKRNRRFGGLIQE